jgi:hypothetical protein
VGAAAAAAAAVGGEVYKLRIAEHKSENKIHPSSVFWGYIGGLLLKE